MPRPGVPRRRPRDHLPDRACVPTTSPTSRSSSSDAHQDYTDEKYGVRYSHDNHMRRSSELPHVGQIVQIGAARRARALRAVGGCAAWTAVIIVRRKRIVRGGVPAALAMLATGIAG